MNATELVIQGIKDKYYFINEETGFFLGEKTIVHILLVWIGIIVFLGILIFFRKKKKPVKEVENNAIG